jgi:adenosylhomocysteine nucleosidase
MKKKELLIITALETELKKDLVPPAVNIVYTGVGKVNAAMKTYQAIHQFQPTWIINFGTVGKVNTNLDGLIEIAKVIQRDMNAEPLAPRGKTPFSQDPIHFASLGGRYLCGTGDSFVNARDQWLLDQKVDVVDMELFAIAAVAHHHQIPWRAFKYITDAANEESGKNWQERVHHGQELFLEKLNEIFS